MSGFTFNTILGLSIIIPSLLGVARSKQVIRTFHPILILFVIALINELLSMLFSSSIYNTAYNNNIYVLIESLLFIWQFFRWGFLEQRKRLFAFMLFITISIWVFDNLMLHSLSRVNPLFRVYYSSLLIYLSIDQVNRLIVNERSYLFGNSKFLFCAGIILFYSYKTFIESFYLFELPLSNQFYANLFLILAFVNLFVNFLYGLAVLCIPTREKFTMRF